MRAKVAVAAGAEDEVIEAAEAGHPKGPIPWAPFPWDQNHRDRGLRDPSNTDRAPVEIVTELIRPGSFSRGGSNLAKGSALPVDNYQYHW